MPSARRAVFLDRDGTLIFDRGYMHRPSDLRLRPHVSQGLRELQARGFDLVLVTDGSADELERERCIASYFSQPHMSIIRLRHKIALRDAVPPRAIETWRQTSDQKFAFDLAVGFMFHRSAKPSFIENNSFRASNLGHCSSQ